MTRDPDVFADPEEFRPERFMGVDFSENEVGDPKKLVFGFGRRSACYYFSWRVVYDRDAGCVLGSTLLTAVTGLQSPTLWPPWTYVKPVMRTELRSRQIPPSSLVPSGKMTLCYSSCAIDKCNCSHSTPFLCDIRPRSAKHDALIQEVCMSK